MHCSPCSFSLVFGDSLEVDSDFLSQADNLPHIGIPLLNLLPQTLTLHPKALLETRVSVPFSCCATVRGWGNRGCQDRFHMVLGMERTWAGAGWDGLEGNSELHLGISHSWVPRYLLFLLLPVLRACGLGFGPFAEDSSLLH